LKKTYKRIKIGHSVNDITHSAGRFLQIINAMENHGNDYHTSQLKLIALQQQRQGQYNNSADGSRCLLIDEDEPRFGLLDV